MPQGDHGGSTAQSGRASTRSLSPPTRLLVAPHGQRGRTAARPQVRGDPLLLTLLHPTLHPAACPPQPDTITFLHSIRGSSRTRRPGVDVAARWRLDEEGQRLLQGHAFFRALAAGFAHSTSSQAAERSSMDLRTVDRFVPKCAWQVRLTSRHAVYRHQITRESEAHFYLYIFL